MDNKIIANYIEKNIDLIEHNEWEEFFDNAPSGVGGILYEADIPFMQELGYVPMEAFAYCDDLTNVNIPNNVTSIDCRAFYNCKNLTSVIIPNSMTSIRDAAFYSCAVLKNIQYRGTLEEWNCIDLRLNVFYNCPVDYVQCIDGRALI